MNETLQLGCHEDGEVFKVPAVRHTCGYCGREVIASLMLLPGAKPSCWTVLCVQRAHADADI